MDNHQEQALIDSYFMELEKYIEKLPLSAEAKKYLWIDNYNHFFDSHVPTKEGNTTYGIQSIWQLEQFQNQLAKKLPELKLSKVGNYLKALNSMPPNNARRKVNRELLTLKRQELLAEIGGPPLDDWQQFVKRLLIQEEEARKDEKVPIIETAKQPTRTIQPVPRFDKNALPKILDILSGFFSDEDQGALLALLQKGIPSPKPLCFLDYGNRLAHAFKQLIDANFITSCTKRELEHWISQNFQYYYRSEVRPFTLKYLNDIISTNKDKCKRPLLKIIEHPAINNREIVKA